MKFEDQLSIAYFVAFGAVALGNWLFMRLMTPEKKHRWYGWTALASIALLSPFFVFFAAQSDRPEALLVVLGALTLIGYVTVALVRVCRSCGNVTQPEGFLVAANFCPKCGSFLMRSHLFSNSDKK